MAKSVKQLEFDHERILDCIHCGLCLPKCPSYVVLGTEMDSPRGRIFLMKSVSNETMKVGRAFKTHFDLCLACRACETACPSGVRYYPLLETAQQLIQEKAPRSLRARFLNAFLLRYIFPSSNRLRLVFRFLYLYKKSGFQKVIRATGLLKLFSKKLDAAERFMPAIAGFSRLVSNRIESGATPDKEHTVGLLRGCVMDYFEPESNRATLRILNRCGYSVLIPENQHCCGAIHLHNGEHQLALDCARKTIDAFENEKINAVINNAAGCGAMLKEYENLLSHDPEYAGKAARLSAKTLDISEFLVQIADRLDFHPVHKSIVYDDPCHLLHGQKVSEQPRRLLAKVPGLKILPLNEGDMCCGSAGTFNITQPELSIQVLKRKINNIRESGADTVITANIGCMIQLKRGAQLAGIDLRIRHIVDLLDESLRNASNEPVTR